MLTSLSSIGGGSSTGGSPSATGSDRITAERSINRNDKTPAIPAVQRIKNNFLLTVIGRDNYNTGPWSIGSFEFFFEQLPLVQIGVFAVEGDQFIVGAALDDAAFVE